MYKGKLLRLIDEEIERRAILMAKDDLAGMSDKELIELKEKTNKELNGVYLKR